MRANKDALFAKYINREPGTVMPEKPAPAKAGAGPAGMTAVRKIMRQLINDCYSTVITFRLEC